MQAARMGDDEAVTSMLASGVPLDDDRVDGMWQYYMTPLLGALFNGFTDTSELLLKAGADLNNDRVWNFLSGSSNETDFVRRWIIDRGGRPTDMSDFLRRYRKQYADAIEVMQLHMHLMKTDTRFSMSPFHNIDVETPTPVADAVEKREQQNANKNNADDACNSVWTKDVRQQLVVHSAQIRDMGWSLLFAQLSMIALSVSVVLARLSDRV